MFPPLKDIHCIDGLIGSIYKHTDNLQLYRIYTVYSYLLSLGFIVSTNPRFYNNQVSFFKIQLLLFRFLKFSFKEFM